MSVDGERFLTTGAGCKFIERLQGEVASLQVSLSDVTSKLRQVQLEQPASRSAMRKELLLEMRKELLPQITQAEERARQRVVEDMEAEWQQREAALRAQHDRDMETERQAAAAAWNAKMQETVKAENDKARRAVRVVVLLLLCVVVIAGAPLQLTVCAWGVWVCVCVWGGGCSQCSPAR